MRIRLAVLSALILLSDAHSSEVSFTLPEVTVVGLHMSSISRYSREDVKRSGANSAAEFLSRVSGLSIRDDGASGGKKFVRLMGANVNQVLVLVDGIRIAEVGSGESNLSRIAADEIESIEIGFGSHSEYGGEAIGGVVSIRTSIRAKSDMRIGVRTNDKSTLFESHRSLSHGSLRACVSISHEKGSGAYRYRITEQDGNGSHTLNLGETRRRENNDINKFTVRTTVIRELQHGELRGVAGFEKSEYGLPGYLVPRATLLARQEEEWREWQLSWMHSLKRKFFSAAIAAQSHNRVFNDPDPLSYIHFSHEKSDRLTGSSSFQTKILGGHLSNSLRIEHERLSSEVLSNSSARRNKWQVGATLSRTFVLSARSGQLLHASSGTSIERYGDQAIQVLPNAELWHSIGDKNSIRVGARLSRAYLSPSFYSLFWNDELLAQGNPDLSPEESEMTQLFLRAKTGNPLESNVEVTASHNNVTNLIYWSQSFDGRWKPQNLRRAVVRQIGVSYNQVLVPSLLTGSARMEWLDARDRSGERVSEGKYLIYRPLRSGGVSLNATLFGYKCFVHYQSVGRQAVLATNSKWLQGYELVDAGVFKEIALNGKVLEVGISFDNLTNTDYRTVRFAPMPLREISISISYSAGGKVD
ncbi:TonB-dependent receptor [bacterium]|nr:TonB-dependent receptor [bacterium]